MTNDAGSGRHRGQIVLFALLGLAVVAVGVALASWRSTPQMGGDEEVFRTVDALFTAVTARDEKLLAHCEARLHAHRDAGRLPPDAADSLDRVIAKARAGSWEAAAERLYDFMKNQKREGEAAPPGRKPSRAAKTERR